MGDSQLRRVVPQDPWRRGGEFIGKLTCAVLATRFGLGRVGVVVASQFCGQLFGEVTSQIPSLFPGQSSPRGGGQRGRRPGLQPSGPSRGQPRRPPVPQRPLGDLTPQQLFQLQQQGFDPIGQISRNAPQRPVEAVGQPGPVFPPNIGQDFIGQGPFPVGVGQPGGPGSLGQPGRPGTVGQGVPLFPGQGPGPVPVGQPGGPGSLGQPSRPGVGQPGVAIPGQPTFPFGPPSTPPGSDSAVIGGVGVVL